MGLTLKCFHQPSNNHSAAHQADKLNDETVAKMKSSASLEEATEHLKSALQRASNDVCTQLGRPMTYAEMRERFG